MLQREAEAGSALQSVAIVIVAAVLFGLLGLWAAALHRLSVAGAGGRPAPPPPRTRPAAAPARVPA